MTLGWKCSRYNPPIYARKSSKRSSTTLLLYNPCRPRLSYPQSGAVSDTDLIQSHQGLLNQTLKIIPDGHSCGDNLTFEGEAGSDLMRRLIEVLRVERSTKAKGGASAELDVVCESCNTAVVDLGLNIPSVHVANIGKHVLTHLGERAGVDLVLGGNLQANIAAGRAIPSRLRTGLHLSVDLVVVARAEQTQVIRRCDRSSIAARTIPSSQAVLRDRSLAYIITSLSTDQESLVTERHVEGGGGTFEEIGEQSGVDVGLLVEQVDLAAVGGFRGEVVGQHFGFEAFGDVVFEFEFGVEGVGGGPGLSQGEA
jgi:hypothetical protein